MADRTGAQLPAAPPASTASFCLPQTPKGAGTDDDTEARFDSMDHNKDKIPTPSRTLWATFIRQEGRSTRSYLYVTSAILKTQQQANTRAILG